MASLKSHLLQNLLTCIIFYSTISNCFERRVFSASQLQRLTAQTVSRASASVHKSSVRSESTEIAKKMSMLRADRDQKRREKIAADIATEKADMLYRDFRSQHGQIEGSPLVHGSYDYGFNAQSNDILLVNKNSGLCGSVPAGIVTLALTNFKREFGKYYTHMHLHFIVPDENVLKKISIS